MPPTNKNPDVTVRGGLINVPPSTEPNRPPRHQPDTPRTKKQTTVRPDHQVYNADSVPTPDEPPPTATDLDAPPPDEPETDPND